MGCIYSKIQNQLGPPPQQAWVPCQGLLDSWLHFVQVCLYILYMYEYMYGYISPLSPHPLTLSTFSSKDHFHAQVVVMMIIYTLLSSAISLCFLFLHPLSPIPISKHTKVPKLLLPVLVYVVISHLLYVSMLELICIVAV